MTTRINHCENSDTGETENGAQIDAYNEYMYYDTIVDKIFVNDHGYPYDDRNNYNNNCNGGKINEQVDT